MTSYDPGMSKLCSVMPGLRLKTGGALAVLPVGTVTQGLEEKVMHILT